MYAWGSFFSSKLPAFACVKISWTCRSFRYICTFSLGQRFAISDSSQDKSKSFRLTDGIFFCRAPLVIPFSRPGKRKSTFCDRTDEHCNDVCLVFETLKEPRVSAGGASMSDSSDDEDSAPRRRKERSNSGDSSDSSDYSDTARPQRERKKEEVNVAVDPDILDWEKSGLTTAADMSENRNFWVCWKCMAKNSDRLAKCRLCGKLPNDDVRKQALKSELSHLKDKRKGKGKVMHDHSQASVRRLSNALDTLEQTKKAIQTSPGKRRRPKDDLSLPLANGSNGLSVAIADIRKNFEPDIPPPPPSTVEKVAEDVPPGSPGSKGRAQTRTTPLKARLLPSTKVKRSSTVPVPAPLPDGRNGGAPPPPDGRNGGAPPHPDGRNGGAPLHPDGRNGGPESSPESCRTTATDTPPSLTYDTLQEDVMGEIPPGWVVQEGWIDKKSSTSTLLGAWKARYVVVGRTALYIYKKKHYRIKNLPPNHNIKMTHIKQVRLPKGEEKRMEVELSDGSVLQFKADSREAISHWHMSIHVCKHAIVAEASPTSATTTTLSFRSHATATATSGISPSSPDSPRGNFFGLEKGSGVDVATQRQSARTESTPGVLPVGLGLVKKEVYEEPNRVAPGWMVREGKLYKMSDRSMKRSGFKAPKWQPRYVLLGQDAVWIYKSKEDRDCCREPLGKHKIKGIVSISMPNESNLTRMDIEYKGCVHEFKAESREEILRWHLDFNMLWEAAKNRLQEPKKGLANAKAGEKGKLAQVAHRRRRSSLPKNFLPFAQQEKEQKEERRAAARLVQQPHKDSTSSNSNSGLSPSLPNFTSGALILDPSEVWRREAIKQQHARNNAEMTPPPPAPEDPASGGEAPPPAPENTGSMCEECDKAAATVLCPTECGQKLCAACDGLIHRFGKRATHQRTTLAAENEGVLTRPRSKDTSASQQVELPAAIDPRTRKPVPSFSLIDHDREAHFAASGNFKPPSRPQTPPSTTASKRELPPFSRPQTPPSTSRSKRELPPSSRPQTPPSTTPSKRERSLQEGRDRSILCAHAEVKALCMLCRWEERKANASANALSSGRKGHTTASHFHQALALSPRSRDNSSHSKNINNRHQYNRKDMDKSTSSSVGSSSSASSSSNSSFVELPSEDPLPPPDPMPPPPITLSRSSQPSSRSPSDPVPPPPITISRTSRPSSTSTTPCGNAIFDFAGDVPPPLLSPPAQSTPMDRFEQRSSRSSSFSSNTQGGRLRRSSSPNIRLAVKVPSSTTALTDPQGISPLSTPTPNSLPPPALPTPTVVAAPAARKGSRGGGAQPDNDDDELPPPAALSDSDDDHTHPPSPSSSHPHLPPPPATSDHNVHLPPRPTSKTTIKTDQPPPPPTSHQENHSPSPPPTSHLDVRFPDPADLDISQLRGDLADLIGYDESEFLAAQQLHLDTLDDVPPPPSTLPRVQAASSFSPPSPPSPPSRPAPTRPKPSSSSPRPHPSSLPSSSPSRPPPPPPPSSSSPPSSPTSRPAPPRPKPSSSSPPSSPSPSSHPTPPPPPPDSAFPPPPHSSPPSSSSSLPPPPPSSSSSDGDLGKAYSEYGLGKNAVASAERRKRSRAKKEAEVTSQAFPRASSSPRQGARFFMAKLRDLQQRNGRMEAAAPMCFGRPGPVKVGIRVEKTALKLGPAFIYNCNLPGSVAFFCDELVPIAPQASLDLLCNPDWTDAEVYAQSFSQLLPSHRSHCRIDEVTPDWSDNSAVHRTFICDYDPFEPPFDVFDSWNSYADFTNADTTLSPDICSHADTSNTHV
eukprot:g29190.t1